MPPSIIAAVSAAQAEAVTLAPLSIVAPLGGQSFGDAQPLKPRETLADGAASEERLTKDGAKPVAFASWSSNMATMLEERATEGRTQRDLLKRPAAADPEHLDERKAISDTCGTDAAAAPKSAKKAKVDVKAT